MDLVSCDITCFLPSIIALSHGVIAAVYSVVIRWLVLSRLLNYQFECFGECGGDDEEDNTLECEVEAIIIRNS
jgi:hypothetical protein